MRGVTLPFRKAVYQALQGIEYNGVVINSFEEEAQEMPSKQISIIPVGNVDVKVFIILANQVSNDNSNKHQRNDEVSLQIQVKTEYPSNKGDSEISEKVMNSVYDRLFDYRGLFKNIELEFPFTLWKLDSIGTRNLNYTDKDCRTWMCALDILGHVNQLPLPVNNSGFPYSFDFALA